MNNRLRKTGLEKLLNFEMTGEKFERLLKFYLGKCQNTKMPQLTNQLMRTIEILYNRYEKEFPDIAEKYKRDIEEEKARTSLYQN